MLTVTELAATKISELMASKGQGDLALRIAISGRGPGGFMYHLQFVEPEAQLQGDTILEETQFQVFIDAKTAPNLEGSTLDFVDDVMERGFKIDNPNPLWHDPLALSVQQIIDERINPAIASHGGYVSLLDVKDQIAYIQLGGGCQGCGMADVTLKQGIEVMILDSIPEITRVIDTTDHAAGTNPYFRPSKGGQSPLAGG